VQFLAHCHISMGRGEMPEFVRFEFVVSEGGGTRSVALPLLSHLPVVIHERVDIDEERAQKKYF